jgi:hypothetical protein
VLFTAVKKVYRRGPSFCRWLALAYTTTMLFTAVKGLQKKPLFRLHYVVLFRAVKRIIAGAPVPVGGWH